MHPHLRVVMNVGAIMTAEMGSSFYDSIQSNGIKS